MSKPSKDIDFAKRIKIIEWLKTEVIDQTARLFKGIWEGSEQKITDALASLISISYILGRRLGVSFSSLDEAILDKLKQHQAEGHQLEDWYQDISHLEQHIHKR